MSLYFEHSLWYAYSARYIAVAFLCGVFLLLRSHIESQAGRYIFAGISQLRAFHGIADCILISDGGAGFLPDGYGSDKKNPWCWEVSGRCETTQVLVMQKSEDCSDEMDWHDSLFLERGSCSSVLWICVSLAYLLQLNIEWKYRLICAFMRIQADWSAKRGCKIFTIRYSLRRYE